MAVKKQYSARACASPLPTTASPLEKIQPRIVDLAAAVNTRGQWIRADGYVPALTGVCVFVICEYVQCAVMTSKVGKRPLRSLSAHEKMDAIRRVHDGESKASVARDIGVPESTLRGWCKNEDKILYLSRQSTPETDDSEPREKKGRYDVMTNGGVHEPYNLSVKIDSPPAAAAAVDIVEPPPESALNLTKEQMSPKQNLQAGTPQMPSASSGGERERNRAELTRLSIELGLNRPEMFGSGGSAANLSLTDGLMAQWNQALAQAVQATTKMTNKLRHSIPATPHSSMNIQNTHFKPHKSRRDTEHSQPQSVDDSVWYWLKTQQAMLGLMSQNPTPDTNSSWFWKWYKQFAYSPQAPQTPDTTVLYQQLTKDDPKPDQKTPEKSEQPPKPIENIENKNGVIPPPVTSSSDKPKNQIKARAVLDTLLLNNNNNIEEVAGLDGKKDKDDASDCEITPNEALEHGEKFLKWLECFSDPSVTAMQVLQFRYLLNNVRSCTDRKNSCEQPKSKVRRK